MKNEELATDLLNLSKAIVLDHLYGWEFVLINPTHKFPKAVLFIGYFLDFEIKERPFCIFDSLSESLLIFNILRSPIFCQVFVALIVPPTFCMLCDIDNF